MAFENFREYKYHFTSCSGLYGMLKDYSMNNPYLTMWATHSAFMNDSSEYEYGKEMCMKVLKLYEERTKIPQERSIFNFGKECIEDFLTKDAPFLILDEATSALDNETEKEINRTLQQLKENGEVLTILSIAHRESSLNFCDRIITIK